MERTKRRAIQVFASRLRWWREQRGVSQAGLAELMTERGHPLNRGAVLAIENNRPKSGVGERRGERRGVSLDESLAFAYTLNAAPAAMLTPDEGELLELVAGISVDGEGLRQWLSTGNPVLAWPASPTEEDRAALDARLERDVAAYAQALIDANRAHDRAGQGVALDAIVRVVDRHRVALEQIERKGKAS